jgi:hypothetical protein
VAFRHQSARRLSVRTGASCCRTISVAGVPRLQVSGQVSLHLSFQHWPISFASSHLELLRTFTIFLTLQPTDASERLVSGR